MQTKPRMALATVLTIAGVLAVAGTAGAVTLRGVVVHKNTRAHSFVVAGAGGRLAAIHARHTPALGRHVRVSARLLRNGTYAAKSVHVGHAVKRVRVRGTVTYANAGRHMFVVSARGVSLLVHGHSVRRAFAMLAAASDPAVGQVVTVDGTVSGDSVDASQVQNDGTDVNGFDLEGVVQAIDTTARTLTVSADDSEESAATLTVDVPASFDLTLFAVGQPVELIVSPNPDGTFTLQQSSNDGNGNQANNPGDNQGDGHGDNQLSAEQQCNTQASDPNFAASHNGLSFTQFYETDPAQPSDAVGRCVDAMANSTPSSPSPELQCHFQASDPSFPAAHSGLSFVQFYDPGNLQLNDAYGRCFDAMRSQSDGSGSGGSGGSTSGS